MADTVIGSASIELELKQEQLSRKLDDVERKTQETAKRMEKGMGLSLNGIAKAMLGVVAASGTLEAGFRTAGAAVAIANGDMEAAESALRAIPGGVGAAAGALIDLKRILDQDTEAARAFKEQLMELGRVAGDPSSIEGVRKALERVNREIARMEGRTIDPLTRQFFDQKQAIDQQVAALDILRYELEALERNRGAANLRLEKIDVANSVRALREGELGRGAMGLLGSITPSFGVIDGQEAYNALIDSLREVGVTARTTDGAIAELEQRMASLNGEVDELDQATHRLQELRREAERTRQQEVELQQAEQARRQREDEMGRESDAARALRQRIALLREEDDLERRRLQVRQQLEDRLREESSQRLRRLYQEEAELRLKAIDEEERRRRGSALGGAGAGPRLREFEAGFRGLEARGFTAEEFRRLLPGVLGGGGGKQSVEDEGLKRVAEQIHSAVLRGVNSARGAVFGR